MTTQQQRGHLEDEFETVQLQLSGLPEEVEVTTAVLRRVLDILQQSDFQETGMKTITRTLIVRVDTNLPDVNQLENRGALN